MLPLSDEEAADHPNAKRFCDMTAAEKDRVLESLRWLVDNKGVQY